MDNHKLAAGENVLARFGADCEQAVIVHVLTRTNGNQAEAARLLGTTKRSLAYSLAYKIHKYRINCEQFK